MQKQHVRARPDAPCAFFLPSARNKQSDHNTVGKVRANELFCIKTDTIDYGFPLKLLTVEEEQIKEEDN